MNPRDSGPQSTEWQKMFEFRTLQFRNSEFQRSIIPESPEQRSAMEVLKCLWNSGSPDSRRIKHKELQLRRNKMVTKEEVLRGPEEKIFHEIGTS
ncbi:hypothetical protein SUGI_0610710 [Cryptomeria japonica]|nr:hypothetical protein SUGI_0610710 [Cryptomeria japonica]